MLYVVTSVKLIRRIAIATTLKPPTLHYLLTAMANRLHSIHSI